MTHSDDDLFDDPTDVDDDELDDLEDLGDLGEDHRGDNPGYDFDEQQAIQDLQADDDD